MRPVHFLFMALALVTGVLLARRSQGRLPLSGLERMGVLLGGLIGAMAGAKLPFLFTDWSTFLSGAAWLSDGKTILTGLVGGYLGVEVAKWSLDIRTSTGDSFLVPVATAIGIGRIGCFFGGCCYGLPASLPWGVVFPAVDALPRHPTQLYEAVFHFAAAAIGLALERTRFLKDNRIRVYILVYALYRFLSEWLRPEARLYFGLTGYQLASLFIAALMAWLWLRSPRGDEAPVRHGGSVSSKP
jgi:phosphatidylglycerol:prolipoprotein diacylglycerol transferase